MNDVSVARPKARRHLLVALGAVLLTGTLAACGGGSGSSSDTITIGSIHPLTGPLALDGQQSDEGAKLAVKEINAAGGIKSLDGAKLKLASADSKGDPATGRREAQRLVDNGAKALVGAYQSAVSTTVVTVSERARVPFVMDITAADAVLRGGDGSFAFRVQPNASTIGAKGATNLVELAKQSGQSLKTVAYMHDSSEFGTTIADAFTKEAKANGIDVKLDIPYDPLNATDFTTEIARVKAAKVDVLVVTGYVPDGNLIAKNVQSVQPGVKLVYGVAQAAFEADDFAAQVGEEASEGVATSTIRYDAQNPRFEKVAASFKKETGDDMRLSAAYSYQAVETIAAALEEAGSSDGQKVQSVLAKLKIDETVLAYPITFGSDGENSSATPIVVQIQDGKLVQVAPEDVKQSDVRISGNS